MPFSESAVLAEMLSYLKKTLSLVDVDILTVEDALEKQEEAGYTKSIIESSEPGCPAFEYRNV